MHRNKKNIYLHEFNVCMGNSIYLPNVSGMLQAFAESKKEVTQNYRFMPFIFIQDKISKMVKKYNNPTVLAFSSSMWNHQFNLALAKAAKKKFPKALVVFGGPQIPQADPKRLEEFLKQNTFIDIVVRGEGEETFTNILITYLKTKDFSDVKGVTFINPKTKKFAQTLPRPLLLNMDTLPSPYLTGVYEKLLKNRGDFDYQIILETNRGCPFGCAFCYWGNGRLGRRMRLFSLDRIKKEIDWLAKSKIRYVFGADSNFGMIKRDLDIAKMFAKAKNKYGSPQTFRVCYGKNAEENIFKIAQLLEDHQLCKGVTLSFQSTNPSTLKAIGRTNIKFSVYRNLQKRYHEAKIPVYTELLLGLPNETYKSFVNGIEESLENGLYDQIAIFFCEVLPNTDMDDSNYAKKHEIKTKKIILAEPHASKRKNSVHEYEDIVISTSAMSLAEWKKSAIIAWLAQALHGLKLSFYVSLYLFNEYNVKYTDIYEAVVKSGSNKKEFPVLNAEMKYYDGVIKDILKGGPQCVFINEFGDIAWQIEEATFLRLSKIINQFYGEFFKTIENLLKKKNIKHDKEKLKEVFLYQQSRIVTYKATKQKEFSFSYNIPEYFENALQDRMIKIKKTSQTMILDNPVDFNGNKKEFAKQMAWFGRRDGRMIQAVDWKNTK